MNLKKEEKENKKKKQGFKLASKVFFGIALMFISFYFSNNCKALEVSSEFLTGQSIGPSYPEYNRTIAIDDDADYIIVYVRMTSPYIVDYFDYVKIDNGYGDEELTQYSDTLFKKSGWFVYDNTINNRGGSATLKIEADSYNDSLTQVDVFYIVGVNSLVATDRDSRSSTYLQHDLTLGTYSYPDVFVSGGSSNNSQYSSLIGGIENHNYGGTFSYSSSTPSDNSTLRTNFGSGTSRSSMAFVFEGKYNIEYTNLYFDTNPFLVYTSPFNCQYGADCEWPFFYGSITDTNATGTATLIELEGGTTVSSFDFWLNTPFQTFTYTISSSTAGFINDVDDYYISIDQNESVLWSATGTIIWVSTSTASYWADDLLPDCTPDVICTGISSSTDFWSSENFGCGFAIGLCYAIKPSGASVNGFLSALGGLSDNFPFNTVFGVFDDLSNWKTEQVSESEASIYIYQGEDHNDKWLYNVEIVPNENIIYGEGRLFTQEIWGEHTDTIYSGDVSIMSFLSLIMDLGLLYLIFIMVMRRVNKHKDLEDKRG